MPRNFGVPRKRSEGSPLVAALVGCGLGLDRHDQHSLASAETGIGASTDKLCKPASRNGKRLATFREGPVVGGPLTDALDCGLSL